MILLRAGPTECLNLLPNPHLFRSKFLYFTMHFVIITNKALSHFEPTVQFASLLVNLGGIQVTIVYHYDERFLPIIAQHKQVSFHGMELLNQVTEDGHEEELIDYSKNLNSVLVGINEIQRIDLIIYEMFTTTIREYVSLKIEHSVLLTIGAIPASHMIGYVYDYAPKQPVDERSMLIDVNSASEASEILSDIDRLCALNNDFRGGRLPTSKEGIQFFYAFNEYTKVVEAMESSKHIFLNDSLGLGRFDFPHVPQRLQDKFRLVGPVAYFSPVIAVKHPVLDWLDHQESQSVIYIAHGSIWKMNADEVLELYNALLDLNVPFIWSLSKSLQHLLPIEPVSGPIDPTVRSVCLGWAPQRQVLQHPSIKVFVSHCGWNSLMEGVASGVPIVAWPVFAEQYINALALVSLQIGVLINGTGMMNPKGVKSLAIKQALEKSFDAIYKEQMVSRQKKVLKGLLPGGTSYQTIVDCAQ
jgi:hypothetical protein